MLKCLCSLTAGPTTLARANFFVLLGTFCPGPRRPAFAAGCPPRALYVYMASIGPPARGADDVVAGGNRYRFLTWPPTDTWLRSGRQAGPPLLHHSNSSNSPSFGAVSVRVCALCAQRTPPPDRCPCFRVCVHRTVETDENSSVAPLDANFSNHVSASV